MSVDRVESFEKHRPLLFSIAYRMLGSIQDAEDMVQEAFLRWQQAPADAVQSPKAYLTAVVTRLCIDRLRSARAQREQYVGVWLPEPLPTAQVPGVADTAALAESLSMAFLVLLESLSPLERAVFLLREVFEYGYAEIARIVGRNEAHCRQMFRRSRQRIAARRPRFRVSPEQQDRLVRQFVRACATGDMEGLLALLAEDIVLYSDGGGMAGTARKPIYGRARVARLIAALLRKAPPTLTLHLARINGQPGVIAYADGKPLGVLVFDSAEDRLQTAYLVVHPEKLRRIPLLRAGPGLTPNARPLAPGP